MATVRPTERAGRRAALAALRRDAPPRLHASCRAGGAACGAGAEAAPSRMPALSPPRRDTPQRQLASAAPSVAMNGVRSARRHCFATSLLLRSSPMAADALAASTDFSNAKFNKEDVAAAVVSQYDDDATRMFYQIVMGARPPRPPPQRSSAPARLAEAHTEKPAITTMCDTGGGGESIHYGIFRSPSDGVKEASDASTDFMMTCMEWTRPVRHARSCCARWNVRCVCACRGADSCGGGVLRALPAAQVTSESRVLDLGSGHGGCAHALVQRFGCRVQARAAGRHLSRRPLCALLRRYRTAPAPHRPSRAHPAQCLNICPQQNEVNRARCVELGIADRVDIALGAFPQPLRAPAPRRSRHPAGNFNDGLPAAWAGKFDAVFSAEVLCHAADKPALLAAVAACLRPGGALVFSDIMGADGADEAALRAFTERNATTSLGRPAEYAAAISGAGLRQLAWWDNSHHLERYFRAMLAQIDAHEGAMLAAGLTERYLADWRRSLSTRADTQAKLAVFAWGVFVARKPDGA